MQKEDSREDEIAAKSVVTVYVEISEPRKGSSGRASRSTVDLGIRRRLERRIRFEAYLADLQIGDF